MFAGEHTHDHLGFAGPGDPAEHPVESPVAGGACEFRIRVENHSTRRPNSKGCELLRATRASPLIMARGSPVKDTEPASETAFPTQCPTDFAR